MQPSHSTRTAVLASAGIVLVLAACSSSTSPTKPYTPAVAAEFFDSIYSARLAAGTAIDSGYAQFVVEDLEPDPAFGATRQTVAVTTISGTQSWYAFAKDVVYSAGDSDYFVVAYSDDALTNVLFYVAEFFPDGDSAFFSILFSDNLTTDVADSVVTSFSGSVNSIGGTCSLLAGLKADSVIALENVYETCHTASLSNSISVIFPAGAGLGALESWSIGPTTFAGLRVTRRGGCGSVTTAPTRMAAVLVRARARLDQAQPGRRHRSEPFC